MALEVSGSKKTIVSVSPVASLPSSPIPDIPGIVNIQVAVKAVNGSEHYSVYALLLKSKRSRKPCPQPYENRGGGDGFGSTKVADG